MYERRYKGEVILVVCSFADKPLSWKIPRRLSRKAAKGKEAELLLSNYPRTGSGDRKEDFSSKNRDSHSNRRNSRLNEIGKKHFVKMAEICCPLRPYEAQVWRLPGN
jgi:hypothetical protein